MAWAYPFPRIVDEAGRVIATEDSLREDLHARITETVASIIDGRPTREAASAIAEALIAGDVPGCKTTI